MGHSPMLERPEETAKLMLEFIAKEVLQKPKLGAQMP